MERQEDTPEAVLNHWHLVEMFSPQPAPKLDPTADSPVVQLRPRQAPPWHSLPQPTPTKKGEQRVWQHTVYVGVYEIESIYDLLHRLFTPADEAYDPRPPGQSACAAFMVDHEGRILLDTVTLSSAAWALGQIKSRGSSAFQAADFEHAQKQLADSVEAYLGNEKHSTQAQQLPSLTLEHLAKIRELATTAAGVTGNEEINRDEIRVASRVVLEKDATDSPGFEFLNSFFLSELEQVLASGPNEVLDTLLKPTYRLDLTRRQDAIQTPDVLRPWLDPNFLMTGRWPSNPKHALSSSQQFAVNYALFGDDHGGVIPVNGPPGTGKTTMLRDIIAGNVVRRATALAQLRHPREAFTGEKFTFTSNTYEQRVRKLRPELTGYEMVVCSSNNGAIENISHELPQRSSLGEPWSHHANYFSDLAARLMNQDPGQNSRYWGLVAAPLGKKKNRTDFRSRVWFSPRNEHTTTHGLDNQLKAWESKVNVPSWNDAKHAFLTAQAEVDRHVQRALAAQRRLHAMRPLEQQIYLTEETLARLTEELTLAEESSLIAARNLEDSERAATEAEASYRRHLELRPSWWENLITLGTANKTWRQRAEPVQDAVEATQRDVSSASRRHQEALRSVKRLTEQVRRTQAQLTTQEHEHQALRHDVAKDEDYYGAHYPGELWHQSADNREKYAPWQSKELNTARSELFLAALELHRAFIANADVRSDLRAAICVMVGDTPKDLAPQTRLAAWQMFFLAVPVISTTFASLGRMFDSTPPEGLGWALVDEAGQATPAAAVGALWRCRRAVIVGDPLQLQPVVNIPNRAELDIAMGSGVSADWHANRQSLQTIADRVARYGATLHIGPQPIWVASPLRIHRRCNSPMFDISNGIAYENSMIHGFAPPADDSPIHALPPSEWSDIEASSGSGHLQRAEIRVVRERVQKLVNDFGLKPSEIILVSPFRVVANELRKLSYDYPGLVAGTVHTSQGKEATVVFFVLGSNKSSPGARVWASATPNLLNVAASRAKHRLYVVGDYALWHDQPYFSTAAQLLPRRKVHTD